MENAKLIPTSSIFELILEKIPAAVIILQNEDIAYINESFLEFWVTGKSKFDSSKENIKIADFIAQDSLVDFRDFLMDLDEEEHYVETILRSEDNEYRQVLVYGRISYDIDLQSLVSEFDGNKLGKKVKNKDHASTALKQKAKKSKKKSAKKKESITIKKSTKSRKLRLTENIISHHKNSLTLLVFVDISERASADLHKHSDLIENMSEILQGIKDPILILNLLHEITYMNTSGLKLLGLNPTQFLILNKITVDVFKEPQNKIIKAAAEAVLRSNTPLNNQEISMVNSYKTQSHFLMSVIPMHDPNYNIDSIMIHLRDVTVEKNAEKELGLLNEQIIAQNKQLKEYAYNLEQENIDLRSAKNIEPVQESNNILGKEGGKYTDLEEGKIYLILERKPKLSYEVFLDQLSLKKPGLIISRHHPDSVRKKYNLAKTPIIWLNKSRTDEKNLYYQPNLELLLHIIKNFVKDSKKSGVSSILLIDGLEYLVIFNEFKKTLQFLELLNEIIMLQEGILLISLDKEIFDNKEFAFIMRNSYLLDE